MFDCGKCTMYDDLRNQLVKYYDLKDYFKNNRLLREQCLYKKIHLGQLCGTAQLLVKMRGSRIVTSRRKATLFLDGDTTRNMCSL